MELMPYCPHCGCVLHFFGHYDCYDDVTKTLAFAHGSCPQCHRKYSWTDVYVLHHMEDLEEEE